MRQSHTRKRAVRAAGTAVVALAFATLAVVAGSRPASAASETINIGRNPGSTVYYVSVVPSSASRCHLDDRLHPVTPPALRTFQKVLDAQASIVSVVQFTCKAALIYAGESGSCSVFRLTGCKCIAGCL